MEPICSSSKLYLDLISFANGSSTFSSSQITEKSPTTRTGRRARTHELIRLSSARTPTRTRRRHSCGRTRHIRRSWRRRHTSYSQKTKKMMILICFRCQKRWVDICTSPEMALEVSSLCCVTSYLLLFQFSHNAQTCRQATQSNCRSTRRTSAPRQRLRTRKIKATSRRPTMET